MGNQLQNELGKLGKKLQNWSGKSGMRYKRTWEVRKIGAHVNKVISLRRSINDLLDVSRLVFGLSLTEIMANNHFFWEVP